MIPTKQKPVNAIPTETLTTKTKITQNTLKMHLRASQRDKYVKQIVRDTEMQGFSLTVNQGNIGSWWVQFRPKGKTPDGKRWPYKSMKIGDTSTHSVECARNEAKVMKAAAIQGRDPHAEAIKKREQEEIEKLAKKSLSEALEKYKKHVKKRLKANDISWKYWESETLYAGNAVKAITREHKEKTGSDVVLLESIQGKAVIEALRLTDCSQHAKKHMEGACSRMFSYCSDWLAVNPIKTLNTSEKIKKGKARTEHPTLHTMAKFWIAAEDLATVVQGKEFTVPREMVRFMLLVPARQSNITEMTWGQIDWRNKTWNVPAPDTKNLEALTIQLSPAAIEILRIRKFPTKGKGLVFPNTKNKIFSAFGELKERLTESAGVKGTSWRFHDFRRSFVSELAEKKAGHDETVLDLILNHAASQSRSGVMGVYQVSKRMGDRKAALLDWSERLLAEVDVIKAEQQKKQNSK